MEEKKQVDLGVFEWFKTHVLNSKLEPSIGDEELVSDSEINPFMLFVHSSSLFLVFLHLLKTHNHQYT